MRTFVVVAMLIAFAPAAAYAQKKSVTTRTDEQTKTDAEIDQAYQNALSGTRSKKLPAPAKVDPWQTVRPAVTDKVKQ
jgi:hypothetical protein